MKKTNKAGLDLIKEFEGFREKPYLCSANVPTIGYGITFYRLQNNKRVTLQDPPITEDQAEKELVAHLSDIERTLNNFNQSLNLNLNENQFSALVSLAYNVGTGAITLPSRAMYTALREKDAFAIQKAFNMYCKVTVNGKKKVLPGLLRRRIAEERLFFS